MRSIVSVIKTEPKSVFDDMSRMMADAQFTSSLDKNSTTILKDNISWHFPYLSANTTPWQLEGVIRALKGAGYESLSSVHNNTVVTDPFKGGKMNKLKPIYEKYGIEEKYNFDPKDIKWIIYKPKAKMRVLDKIYPEGIHIPEYFMGKNILHLPTVKTHIYTKTTGAMKNAFGGLLNTKRHYTHTWIHETLVDLLAIQKEIHAGIFSVMDGTICGNGPGPRTMIPCEKDYMLASSDSVAIDAVAAKMMGFDPMKIKYIRLAHESGLGVGDINDIEVRGEDIAAVNFNFTVGSNFASRFGHALWFSKIKWLQRVLFRTPLVYLFVFGSFFYHDYIWWNFKGKKIQKDVRKNTKWGKFFADYK
ncbi:DUF362 domain-containing protein [Candidatus Auribacterota bacterium]